MAEPELSLSYLGPLLTKQPPDGWEDTSGHRAVSGSLPRQVEIQKVDGELSPTTSCYAFIVSLFKS